MVTTKYVCDICGYENGNKKVVVAHEKMPVSEIAGVHGLVAKIDSEFYLFRDSGIVNQETHEKWYSRHDILVNELGKVMKDWVLISETGVIGPKEKVCDISQGDLYGLKRFLGEKGDLEQLSKTEFDRVKKVLSEELPNIPLVRKIPKFK